MLMDKGLSLGQTRDLAEIAASHIDLVKIAVGTAPLYAPGVLAQKLRVLEDEKILTFPGGTLFEVAHTFGRYHEYLEVVREVGFTAVEVSGGTFDIAPPKRDVAIKQAIESGLRVLTEVGSKDPSAAFVVSEVAEIVRSDVSAGADYVVIEARESGLGVGIYDLGGNVREELFEELVAAIGVLDRLIWEAPLKDQQAYLIKRLGPDVNLGNIRPEDTLVLEALRRGLRWDTLHLMTPPGAGVRTERVRT